MPDDARVEKAKKTGLIGVRLPASDAEKLHKIASKKKSEAAELLRRAAYAIIEYYDANGDVPLEMAVTQRALHPRVLYSAGDVEALAAAEEKAPYSATQRLPTARELIAMLEAAKAASKSGDAKASHKAS